MAIALSTAGIKVKYIAVANGASAPTSGYTEISGITAIPEFNPEPANLDCTPLAETAYHQYIPGLKDLGAAIGLTVNMTDSFQTAWGSLVTAYNGGASDIWFEYAVPDMSDSFYFSGAPVDLGFGGAEVDSVLTNTAYIMPAKVTGWATKST